MNLCCPHFMHFVLILGIDKFGEVFQPQFFQPKSHKIAYNCKRAKGIQCYLTTNNKSGVKLIRNGPSAIPKR